MSSNVDSTYKSEEKRILERKSFFTQSRKRMREKGRKKTDGMEFCRSCYPLICTIVGLPEEPPVDKHDKRLIPVYQMIRLYV